MEAELDCSCDRLCRLARFVFGFRTSGAEATCCIQTSWFSGGAQLFRPHLHRYVVHFGVSASVVA